MIIGIYRNLILPSEVASFTKGLAKNKELKQVSLTEMCFLFQVCPFAVSIELVLTGSAFSVVCDMSFESPLTPGFALNTVVCRECATGLVVCVCVCVGVVIKGVYLQVSG